MRRSVRWAIFQFTPLREGRRRRPHRNQSYRAISIHAPPRGATQSESEQAQLNPDFNSRPSARGDAGSAATADAAKRISIHAPPRGATCCRQIVGRVLLHFNSRPSARGDALRAAEVLLLPDFNSRPSARGDGCGNAERVLPRHFNSRPSARGDALFRIFFAIFQISIHAPPRGATLMRARII